MQTGSASLDGVFLEGRSLTRTYRVAEREVPVLREVSLSVRRGERLFLCGASGAGKTTLLYTLAGLERPRAGMVVIDGISLYEIPEGEQARIRNERMGYVFQHFYLLPDLTAVENVVLPAMVARREGRERACEILERVGLRERMHHLPAELSGGEQQRVAIARALINDPDVVFADEPTGNLDSRTGDAVMEDLLALAAERKKTLVVVTHDELLAARGDRTLHLADGRLVDLPVDAASPDDRKADS